LAEHGFFFRILRKIEACQLCADIGAREAKGETAPGQATRRSM